MDIAKSYDAVVVGLGAMGSATFYHLAQRGLKVLGLDRFHSPHEHGSSHGETRLTRLAYFEHSDYVPLIREAHRQWRGLESITGKKVFYQNGLHLFSHPESEIYQGVMDSARQYGLELERSDQNPGPTLFSPDSLSCLTEPTGGYLLSQQAIAQFLSLGKAHGGETRMDQQCLGFTESEQGVVVVTDSGAKVNCKNLVLTCGAWLPQMANDLNLPPCSPLRSLTIHRVPLFWFPVNDKSGWQQASCFAFDLEDGFFYGFPSLDGKTIKVGLHQPAGELDDPLARTDIIGEEERRQMKSFVEKYLRGVAASEERSKVCLYTMSSDEHFIVDRWPGRSGVFFAGGFSGHGFKFCPAIGKIMADWVTQGGTDLPVSFLGLQRFS